MYFVPALMKWAVHPVSGINNPWKKKKKTLLKANSLLAMLLWLYDDAVVEVSGTHWTTYYTSAFRSLQVWACMFMGCSSIFGQVPHLFNVCKCCILFLVYAEQFEIQNVSWFWMFIKCWIRLLFLLCSVGMSDGKRWCGILIKHRSVMIDSTAVGVVII